MSNLVNDVKITKVKAASAAGTTAVTSDIIDMSGFESVAFMTTANAITATGVQSIKIQHGDESDLSDAADVTSASITIADDDDNQTFVVEMSQPIKRYCRAYVSRGTANSAFGEIYALQYGAKLRPVTNDVTDTLTTALVVAA